MKKIITGMLALASLIFSANAQEARKQNDKGHGQRHHQRHHQKDGMMKGLNLSVEQKEQVKAIHELSKNQMAELNKNENITVKEFKERKHAIHQEQKEKISSLLTAEQKEQIAKNKTAQKEKFEMMRAKRLDEMKTKLNLSEEQIVKIKASHEAQQAKVKDIHDNEQLTMSEKKEQLMAIKGQNKDAMKKILTEEQLMKMEEMKKQRSNRSK